MALLAAVPPDARTRRVVQLVAGLLLYGFSDAVLVRAGLGLSPWDVLHQGLSVQTGWSIGTWVMLVGAAVLVLWLPLRQRPGVGTVANVALIGLAMDASLALLPDARGGAARVTLLVVGIGLNAVATASYIGAALGPGPRDGLMTGLARRGHSIRVVRTAIELTVLGTGWLLGGTVGLGTVAYALSIGPLAHVLLPALAVSRRPRPRPAQLAPDAAA